MHIHIHVISTTSTSYFMNIFNFHKIINYTYYFKEARKIIDPIKLGIDPNQKGNAKHKIKSGKKAIEQLTGMYEKLFEDLDDD